MSQKKRYVSDFFAFFDNFFEHCTCIKVRFYKSQVEFTNFIFSLNY